MTRLFALLMASTLAVGLFGCSKPDTRQWSDALSKAVLAVPGVTGGHAEMRMAGVGRQIYCDVTTSASSREELLGVMEAIMRAVVDETRGLDSAMIYLTARNGSDAVANSDVGGIKTDTLEGLREYFA